MELSEVKRNAPENRKADNRRRKKSRAALAVFVILICAALVFGVLCFTVLFPITEITVSGNSIYSGEEIIENSGIKISDKLFAVFSEPVNKALSESLPYVKKAELEKHLPGSLKIKTTEAVSLYCFNSENIYYIADSDYKILDEISEIPDGTVLVKVADEFKFKCGRHLDKNNSTLLLVSKVYNALSSQGISVDSIEVTEYKTVTAKICSRFSVALGIDENTEGKVAHLKSMLAQIDQKNGADCTGKIDLTSWSTQKREGYFELTANF